MCLVLFALYTVFFELKAILQDFLILGRTIVQGFTDGALQFDEGILGHTWQLNVDEIVREFAIPVNSWRILAN